MEDFELRRVFYSMLAFMVVVVSLVYVVTMAAVDTKAIRDHKVKQELAHKGIEVVVND